MNNFDSKINFLKVLLGNQLEQKNGLSQIFNFSNLVPLFIEARILCKLKSKKICITIHLTYLYMWMDQCFQESKS